MASKFHQQLLESSAVLARPRTTTTHTYHIRAFAIIVAGALSKLHCGGGEGSIALLLPAAADASYAVVELLIWPKHRIIT